jgi:hypothetical protein
MKHFVKSMVRAGAKKLLRIADVPVEFERLNRAVRFQGALSLRQKYPHLLRNGAVAQELHKYETKVYSQQGEDGILLHLFDVIGVTDARFVEFGIQDGRECNSANLALNFGWRGLFMECDAECAQSAAQYYRARLGARANDVVVQKAMVTAENINDLLTQNGMAGPIDLLSIDIDGNDFWVWKAISVIQPRVVVTEYNSVFGPERAVTIAYDPAFRRRTFSQTESYFGASLAALAKLGEKKGYSLVGCDSWGVNAFFVSRDAADGRFPHRTAREIYMPQMTRVFSGSLDEDARRISHLPLEQV